MLSACSFLLDIMIDSIEGSFFERNNSLNAFMAIRDNFSSDFSSPLQVRGCIKINAVNNSSRPNHIRTEVHNNEIVDIALATSPDWVCLVPEKREERTTEGGLDLLDETNFDKVSQACTKLKAGLPNLKISLFLEASAETLERAAKLPIDAVEIHTGEYARAFLHGESTESYLGAFRRAQVLLKDAGIGCHAGHGLTQESIQPLLQEGLFAEYNVGHWIICQAVFDGLGKVVATMKESCLQYPLV